MDDLFREFFQRTTVPSALVDAEGRMLRRTGAWGATTNGHLDSPHLRAALAESRAAGEPRIVAIQEAGDPYRGNWSITPGDAGLFLLMAVGRPCQREDFTEAANPQSDQDGESASLSLALPTRPTPGESRTPENRDAGRPPSFSPRQPLGLDERSLIAPVPEAGPGLAGAHADRFRLALRGVPVVMFMQDLDLRYVWVCNPTAEFTCDDILGKTDDELLTPDTAVLLTRLKREILATGVARCGEAEFDVRGDRRVFDVVYTAVRDGAGAIIGLTATSIDSTWRTHVEASLREQESRYASVFETLADGVLLIDDAGQFVEQNGSAARILGVEPDKLSRIGLDFNWEVVDENGHPLSIDQYPASIALRTRQPVRDKVIGVTRSDGKIAWIAVNAHPIPGSRGPGWPAIVVTIEDVTTRLNAERESKRSRERFQTLAEAAFEGIAILEQGVLKDVNPQLLTMLGAPCAERVLGRRLSEFVATPEAARDIESKLAHESSGSCETTLKTFDGRTIFVECHARFSNDEGRRAHLVAMLDITRRRQDEEELRQSRDELERRVIERTKTLQSAIAAVNNEIEFRKKVEESLRQSEERYRMLAEHSGDCLARTTPTGELFYISPASVIISGRRPEELRGRNSFDFIYEEDIPLLVDVLRRSIESSDPITVAYRSKHRDGHVHWLESTLRRVCDPHTGETTEIITVTRDVTERKRVEEQMRVLETAIRHLDEGVLVTEWPMRGVEPRVLFLNDGLRRLIGKPDSQIFAAVRAALETPPVDSASPQPVDDEAHARQGASRISNSLTGDRDIEWSLTPVRNVRGDFTHQVTIIRDVTRRKEEEERLNQIQNRLARVSRITTLGEMVAGIAHELGQPLTAVATDASTCRKKLQPLAAEHDLVATMQRLKRIEEQAVRSGKIIHRLLGMARNKEPHRTTIDLVECVNSVLMLVGADSRMNKIAVRFDHPPGAANVVADRVQIEQVLINLIRNGIESIAESNSTDRRMELALRERGDSFEISVRDSGAGLPENSQHMFDAFFSTKSIGIGLGLAISRTIVESHGGRIWAEPAPGAGAILTFTLPVRSSQPS